MSDINLTIGVEATQVQASINDINQRIELLRKSFHGSGTELSKEMVRTANAIQKLKIPLSEARSELKMEEAALRQTRKAMADLGITTAKLRGNSKLLNEDQLKAVTVFRSQTKVVNDAKKKYNELAEDVEGLTRKYKALSIIQKDAFNGVNIAQRKMQDGIIKTQKEATTSTNKLSSGLLKLKGVANQVAGVFGFGMGLYGVLRLMREAVHVIKDFENAQKQLEAVSGATGRQMSELSRQAILIGSSSKYGIQGVSELQVQLAKMGFTIMEIGAMAEGISKLATATQEDLPKAAETVAFVLRSYNMSATETARVTDVMATSFNSSALDLEKFRQSMKYIAPIANQANFTIEDTAALLGKLADAGISGSLAGTSLRNIISQLADSNSNLSKKVGMTVNNFDDFTEAMWKLNKQGTNLEAVFDIMDRRAASAFTIIMQGVGSLEEFRNALNDSGGAAEKMAKVQMQSLSYQVKLAKASWEGLVVSFDKGEGLLSKAFKGILQGFTGVTSAMIEHMNRQSKLLKEEFVNFKTLDRIISDANIPLNNRIDALKELKTEYPEYFNQLDTDIESSEELGEVLKELGTTIEELRRRIRGEVIISVRSERVEKAKENVEFLESQLNDLYIASARTSEKISENIDNFFDGSVRQRAIAFNKVILESLRGVFQAPGGYENAITDVTEQLNAARENYAKEIQRYENIIWKDPRTSAEAVMKYFREAGKWDNEISDLSATFRKILTESDGFTQSVKNGEVEISKYTGKIAGLQSEYNRLTAAVVGMQQEYEGANIEQEGFYQTAVEDQKLAGVELERYKAIVVALNLVLSGFVDEAKEAARARAEMIRLDQKLAELQIVYTTEGIRQTKELARVRRDYALMLAGIEEDGIKATHLRRVAEMEYLIAIQDINAKVLQEDSLKNSELRKHAEQMNTLYQKLSEQRMAFETGSFDRRNYEERQELELRLNSTKNQAILDGVKRREEDELKVIEDTLKKELNEIGYNLDEYSGMDKEARERIAQQAEELTREYEEKKARIEEQYRQERVNAESDAGLTLRDLLIKQSEERIAVEKEILKEKLEVFDQEQEQAKLVFESQRRTNQERRRFEEEQAIARLRQLREIAEAELSSIRRELSLVMTVDPENIERISELERRLKQYQDTINGLDLQIDIRPFDQESYDEMIESLKNLGKEVANTLKQMTKDREDAAKREREILDGRIAEAQRAVDTELELYEQGFASNVEVKRKELAELEKLRANALKAEEKAIAQRRAMDAVLQATNLISAVSQIIRAESLKGLPGIALAAGGIAAMFALFNNAKKLSSQTTKYEKGGSFTLKGRSHASGGVLLAPGHEAQGGEQVSVFNRSATKRFGSQIRQFTDDINKGKNPLQNINVFADSKDLKAMRKIMEREQVEYHDSYKVIRRGNVTTICRN